MPYVLHAIPHHHLFEVRAVVEALIAYPAHACRYIRVLKALTILKYPMPTFSTLPGICIRLSAWQPRKHSSPISCRPNGS